MKIAIAQLNYHIGNFAENTSKIIEYIGKSKAGGAELVVFTELSVTGYYPHDLLERKEFIEQSEEALNQIATHCTGIAAIVGGPRINPEPRGKKLFNSAFFMCDGAIQHMVDKSLLPTYDIFDEYRHFEPNKTFSIFDFGGKKIAITICEDLWDEQETQNEFGREKLYQLSPLNELSALNPDLVINISASPFSFNQENSRKNILIKNAIKYQLPIVYANQVGAHTELIFDGGSVYLNKEGEIQEELNYFEEDYRIIDTEVSTQNLQPKTEYIEKIYHALVLGIRDYFTKMGFKKATLGLSGGIDSALVLVLAVEALGKENVRVLLMPSRYSSDHSIDDALQLAKNLDIQYEIIPIQSILGATPYVIRREDENGQIWFIPFDEANSDYQRYLADTDGGLPLPEEQA